MCECEFVENVLRSKFPKRGKKKENALMTYNELMHKTEFHE